MKYAILLLVLFVGCRKPDEVLVYEDVDKIFMHQRYVFSFFKQNDDLSIDHVYVYGSYDGDVEMFADVSADKKCWIKVTTDTTVNIEIHIHDVSEIDGGKYDYGKNGSGKVNVIE